MFTMLAFRPSFFSAPAGNTWRTQLQLPRRFTSVSRVHCSSVRSRNGTIVRSGVADEDVDRTELVPDAIDHRLDLCAHGYVRFHRHGPPPSRSHPLCDFLCLPGVLHVVDRHVRAFFGEYLRDTPADAPPGPVTRATLSFSLKQPRRIRT